MKSLQEFKQEPLLEEEKSDYSKFDVLVRAGLANKAQLQRIHKILDKMQEERPVFNNADRMILQNIFNKMVDLITSNKQIFQQTRRAVREDFEEEYIEEATKDLPEDPPYMIILKRRAIRQFPDKTRIALYYSKTLDKHFSVPYGPSISSYIQAEETQIDEAVMDQLHKIVNNKSAGTVKFANGQTKKVDHYTASAITQVHKALNDDNKKKFADMVHKSPEHLAKASDFAFKHTK
jgi:hypothetical protein